MSDQGEDREDLRPRKHIKLKCSTSSPSPNMAMTATERSRKFRERDRLRRTATGQSDPSVSRPGSSTGALVLSGGALRDCVYCL